MAEEKPRVRVTCLDPETGEQKTQELDPNSYIIITGERMYVHHVAQHKSGTVQLTLRRVP